MATGIDELAACGVFDTTPDAVLIVSSAGRVAWVNRRARELFGWTDAELVGHGVEELLPEHLRDGHRAHREAYVASPSARPMGRGLKLVAQRRDGSQLRVEVSLSPLTTESGPHVVVIVRDLSRYLEV